MVKKRRIIDLVLIAVFADILAVCAWICIPSVIPFTLQSLGVFLAVGVLGGKRGTLSVLVYLLLGAVGAPVFSGFSGGFGHIAGPTGGYPVGFLFTALTVWAMEGFSKKSHTASFFSMLIGQTVCYVFGTAWFALATENGEGFFAMLSLCVFPYILPDIAKIAIAVACTKKLKDITGIKSERDS